MSDEFTQLSNVSLLDAAAADSCWVAYIPIVSTHFAHDDDGNIVPNANREECTLNLLEFINTDLLSNNEILMHTEALHYPSSKGTKGLIQLETYMGDDIQVVKAIQHDITFSAMKHSTVLKSTVRRDKRE